MLSDVLGEIMIFAHFEREFPYGGGCRTVLSLGIFNANAFWNALFPVRQVLFHVRYLIRQVMFFRVGGTPSTSDSARVKHALSIRPRVYMF